MYKSIVFWLRLLLLACLFWASNAKAEDAGVATLDFIYVNANIGEAAGGHAAIRLGSTVFHYQFFPQGQFLLVRESWSHFRYVYNELRNRSIFVAQTSLTPPVYAKLRNHFTRLLMAQQQDLDQLQDAETQLSLLTQLASGAEQLKMDFVGLFDAENVDDADMLHLHERIQQQLGHDYLKHLRQQVEARLVDLVGEYESQSNGIPWVARLQALLLERESLQLLATGASLTEGSVLGSAMGATKLTVKQRSILEGYREKLAVSVVGLLQSQRIDRSRSLMLQTARYLVVSRSLATGTLLTLDPFSSRANLVTIKQKNELPGLLAQLQQDVLQAKRNFFTETAHPDIAYAILESSMGRWHEIIGVARYGNVARVEPGILLPARKGSVSITEQFLPRGKLSALIDNNQRKVSQLQQRIDEQYAYDLMMRNCVTELLRALNSAFVDKTTGQRELGGWLAPDDDLVFIPSQFYSQIAARYSIQEETFLPSRRLRQMDEFYRQDDNLRVWLRESNTLSSTVYMPRTEDTPFLFFTDDTLLLRPAQGIVNLLWGAANSVGGVFTLPVDGGERLHQGMRGMFYSLPELVFSNIRKGTYGFAETTTVGP